MQIGGRRGRTRGFPRDCRWASLCAEDLAVSGAHNNPGRRPSSRGPTNVVTVAFGPRSSGGASLFAIFVFVLRSAQFLGESDEKSFRPTNVAEPIRVFILDYFAYELRAARAEPFKRLVDVVHGEHDAEVA